MGNFYSINMSAIAKFQYGSSAFPVLTKDHAFGWMASHNGSLKTMNIQDYYSKTYSSDWRVCLLGVGKYDWRVYNPFRLDNMVQPVVVVSWDMAYREKDVKGGIDRYKENWLVCRDILHNMLGKTFTLSSDPILVIVPESTQYLLQLARSTQNKNLRFDLFYRVREMVERELKRTNPNTKYAVALFTGEHKEEDYGSAAAGNFLVLSSDNTSYDLREGLISYGHRRVAYDMLHELLHTFGLRHTDETHGSNWRSSIMYQGMPMSAILTPFELSKLLSSPFIA